MFPRPDPCPASQSSPLARPLAAWLIGCVLVLACLLFQPGTARADYDAGLAAYDKGDFATAYAEWRPLADAGDARSQHGLGLLYETGQGVPRRSDRDAIVWYRAAAAQGLPAALSNLALMYAEGRGAKRDLSQAAALWEQAALAGHPMAQFNLGLMYYRGEGIEKDDRLAARWFAEAAAQGASDAQFAIAEMYRLGHGVNRDLTEARRWYAMAVEGGHLVAARQLAVLGGPPPETITALPPIPSVKPLAPVAVADETMPEATERIAAAPAAADRRVPDPAAAPDPLAPLVPEPKQVDPAPMSAIEQPPVAEAPAEAVPQMGPGAEIALAEAEPAAPEAQLPAAPDALAPAGATAGPSQGASGGGAVDAPAPDAEADSPPKLHAPAQQGGSAVGEAVLEEEASGIEETVEPPLTPAPPEPLPMPAVEVEPPAAIAAAEPPTVEPPAVDPPEAKVSDAEIPETATPEESPAMAGDAMPTPPAITEDDSPAPDARGTDVAAAQADAPATQGKTYRVWLSEIDGDRDAAAEAEWQRLLEVYPDLLGPQRPLLRRVDLGRPGVRYRVLAGPFDDRAGAGALCAAIQGRNPEEHCMVVLN